MLVHKKCKQPLQLKTNHIVLSNFFVNYNGIALTELEIVEPKKLEYTFYCPECNEPVIKEDTETKCYLCSKYVPLDETVVVKSRGNYHPSCAEEFFKGEPTVKLIDLLNKERKIRE